MYSTGSSRGINRWRDVSLSHPSLHHHYIPLLDGCPVLSVFRTLQCLTCTSRLSPEPLIYILFGPRVLLIQVFSSCLPICQSAFLTPFSPFSCRVVFLFSAVRSMSSLPIRTSLVATLLKLFQVSWHGDNSACKEVRESCSSDSTPFVKGSLTNTFLFC